MTGRWIWHRKNAGVLYIKTLLDDLANASDPMVALRLKLEHGEPNRESEARELLAIAARDPRNPESQNAIFFANQALARAALKRWDRREAVNYLKASLAATPTDRMRYGYIDMSLARGLIDAGRRAAAVEFLEFCATFNQQPGQKLAQWAAEVREGKNPELTPYWAGA